MIEDKKSQCADIPSDWGFYRGDCIGGDGDYSFGYEYHITFNGKEVLSFNVSVYEKTKDEQPISIVIIDDDPRCVKVQVKSFYDNFYYITKNGGKTWFKE